MNQLYHTFFGKTNKTANFLNKVFSRGFLSPAPGFHPYHGGHGSVWDRPKDWPG